MSHWIKMRIGSPSHQGGPATRTRRRSTAVLAVAVAFGVGLVAFPASSAAAPPVVPTCPFPNTAGSDSCATLRVNAVTPPLGGVLEPVGVGFRIRSQFDPPTSEITNIELRFKDNIAIDLCGNPVVSLIGAGRQEHRRGLGAMRPWRRRKSGKRGQRLPVNGGAGG